MSDFFNKENNPFAQFMSGGDNPFKDFFNKENNPFAQFTYNDNSKFSEFFSDDNNPLKQFMDGYMNAISEMMKMGGQNSSSPTEMMENFFKMFGSKGFSNPQNAFSGDFYKQFISKDKLPDFLNSSVKISRGFWESQLKIATEMEKKLLEREKKDNFKNVMSQFGKAYLQMMTAMVESTQDRINNQIKRQISFIKGYIEYVKSQINQSNEAEAKEAEAKKAEAKGKK